MESQFFSQCHSFFVFPITFTSDRPPPHSLILPAVGAAHLMINNRLESNPLPEPTTPPYIPPPPPHPTTTPCQMTFVQYITKLNYT